MAGLKTVLKFALCLAPIALGACGEEWVPVYSHDTFPYGNERTAGSGIVYVRKSLMPAKELKLELPPAELSAEPEPEPVVAAEPEPVVEPPKDPDPVHDAFLDAQAK